MSSRSSSVLCLLGAISLMTSSAALPAFAQTAGAPAINTGPSEPVRNWSRAVEAADLAAIRAMNGPETVAYMPDAMARKGSAEIAAAYAGMFEKFTAKVAIRDASYLESGGIVHSWGLYTLTLTPKDGGVPVTVEGRFSDIATKVDGGWRYVMDHASLPARP